MDNNRLLHTLYHCKIFYQIYLPYKKQWILLRYLKLKNKFILVADRKETEEAYQAVSSIP